MVASQPNLLFGRLFTELASSGGSNSRAFKNEQCARRIFGNAAAPISALKRDRTINLRAKNGDEDGGVSTRAGATGLADRRRGRKGNFGQKIKSAAMVLAPSCSSRAALPRKAISPIQGTPESQTTAKLCVRVAN